MDPTTLEMLIMLRFNKDLWDVREVNDVMRRMEPEPVAPIADAPTPVAPSSLISEMTGASSCSSSSTSSGF